MLEIGYKPSFIKQMNHLPIELTDEVLEKIDLFKDKNNHHILRIHKLHGKLSNFYNFSINFRFRIIFKYISKKEVVLLAIGDHDVYR